MNAHGAAEVPGLRAGAIVVLKALGPSGEGSWKVMVNGVRLTASVAASLTPGARYTARAEGLPDRPGWAFRILGPAAESRAAEFLGAAGLPGDALSVLALRSLMSEGLPLDPKSLQRLRSVLLRRGPDEDRAALLARALAKGMDPGAAVDALEGTGPPSGSEGEGEGRGDGGQPEGGGQPGGRGDGGPGDREGRPSRDGAGNTPGAAGRAAPAWRDFDAPGGPGEAEPGGEADIRALAGLLRFLSSRSDGNPNPFQLFNSRTGPRGRWIYAPYRFEREGVAFSGTLRILVPGGAGRGTVVSADVLAEDAAGARGRYAFSLRPDGDGFRLSLGSPDAGGEERISGRLGPLGRELADRRCSVRLGSEAGTGEPPSDYEPVDHHA